MENQVTLLNSYVNKQMYNASLLYSEYLYITYQEDILLYFVIKSLYMLNHNERIVNFLNINREILLYVEIKEILQQTAMKMDDDSKNENLNSLLLIIPTKSLELEKIPTINVINVQSYNKYLEGMILKDTLRLKCLVESFKLDYQNLEALYVLRSEKLISKEEFRQLIGKINIPCLKNTYECIFFKKVIPYGQIEKGVVLQDEYPFFSPFQAYKEAKIYYRRNENHFLLKLAVFMFRNHPTSYISYMILGLYYLKIKKYKDAMKSFYEGIQYNKKCGTIYFYLGIVYSFLKEGESTIMCFKKAINLSIGSYKPILYLASEYQKMNDVSNAQIFYKMAIEKKAVPNSFFKYACYLYQEDEMVKFEKILHKLKEINLNGKEIYVYNLLVFYYHLEHTEFDKAEESLKQCNIKDWVYFACYGYLLHLQGRIDEALEFYNESLMMKEERILVIEDLIGQTVDKEKSNEMLELSDYGSELFMSIRLQEMHEKIV